MSTERSPLLSDTHRREVEAGRSTAWTLRSQARALLDRLKHGHGGGSERTAATVTAVDHPIRADPDAELATLLYALVLLENAAHLSGQTMRAQLATSAINDELRRTLCDRIEDLLDGEESASDAEHANGAGLWGGERITVGAGTDDEVERMCWCKWPEDDTGRIVSGERQCGAWDDRAP